MILCHHEYATFTSPAGSAPPKTLDCVHCGQELPVSDFLPPQNPFVIFPACKCSRCVAGRTKQKDRIE